MYKRVLVAVGDYPEADRPLEYAIALAAHTDAELCLLRVLLSPSSLAHQIWSPVPRWRWKA